MESQRFRLTLLALAAVLATEFFLPTRGYWVAADPGVDENAYLVSGKLLAQTGSPGFIPPDPYSLVGKMWIGTPEGRFYPKYPLGETLLVALAVKTAGLRAAYWISPLLMTLALLGVFLLGREIAGSFAGLLAMIAMAASPATLNEVNDPDSHASSLCCTTWGMLLLLRWWRTGKLHQAALAGLLLGYSAIIRYTEGLLLLPIALVVLFRCGRRPDRPALGGAAALAAGWLAPVAGQVLFNLRALHSLTGYDTTHESTAFSLAYFVHNALPTARLLATLGLPILLFVGVLGLAVMAFREGRLAAVLWAWLLPNLLLYTAYYWGLQTDDVNCLRFFLTILHPLPPPPGAGSGRPAGPSLACRKAPPLAADGGGPGAVPDLRGDRRPAGPAPLLGRLAGGPGPPAGGQGGAPPPAPRLGRLRCQGRDPLSPIRGRLPAL